MSKALYFRKRNTIKFKEMLTVSNHIDLWECQKPSRKPNG